MRAWYESRLSSLAPSNRFFEPCIKSPPLIRPGAERNLSGWLVREAVSEMSAAGEGRRERARKPTSKVITDRRAFTKTS